MTKGFASLTAGLVARRSPPRAAPEPAPTPSTEAGAALSTARSLPRLVASEGRHLTPSAGLTTDLISAGRAAYRAERQRLAEKAMGLSPEGTVVASGAPPMPTSMPGPGAPTVRDVAGAVPGDRSSAPLRPSAPLTDLIGPRTPTGAPAPARGRVQRRRAVTLRLRPDQHVRLLRVRRSLGCSFQVLVVRAMVDFLDNLDGKQTTDRSAAAPRADAARPEPRAVALTEPVSTPAVELPPDVHFFTLPSGWCIAAWQQGGGGGVATPSEVLGQVLRDRGVMDLIAAADRPAGAVPVESVSFGDQGYRLALTIRLEPELHQRLLAARNRLGRTGQDILMASIDAYLTA